MSKPRMNGPSQAQSPKKGPSAQSHLIALEPRMMFDGAGVATAIEGQTQQDVFEAFKVDALTVAPEPLAPRAERAPQEDWGWIGESMFGEKGFTPGYRLFAAPVADFAVASLPRDAATSFIFIDTSVIGYETLVREWTGKGNIVLIDPSKDGIDQVRTALAGQSNLSAIHIVSHGDDGYFNLGTTRVDAASVSGSLASSFAAIGSKLSESGDILIYGCDVGAGAAGQQLVDLIAKTTGADVAASIDATGSMLRGGDWTLENRLGEIDGATLVSRDWDGLLAPAPLVGINGNLTVRDGAGATVVFTAGQSASVGAGAVARWTNVSTISGTQVDLVATVVSLTNASGVRFNQPGTNSTLNDDFGILLVSSAGTGNATAVVNWSLVRTGTNTPFTTDITLTVADIDGIDTTTRREFVTVSTDTLSSFESAGATRVQFDTNTPGAVTAFGTADENGAAESGARFNWLNTSGFQITYNLNRANGVATQALFNHDGDLDFNFGTGGVTTSIPRLDLDANDSTSGGSGYLGTFVENGAAVKIVDTDVTITNPIGTVITSTVTLTNLQSGDQLLVNGSTATSGTLVGGISYTITGGNVIRLSGASTAANYQSALQAITFKSTSENPATVDRSITVSFGNGTFSSNVATSTIKVIAVNDTPTLSAPASYSGTEDTALTLGGITMGDLDSSTESIQLSVSVPAGVGILNFATTPFVSVTNNGTGSLILQGQRGAIQSAVNSGALTLAPATNYNGSSTVTFVFNDRGNTGRDPGLTGDATSEEARATTTVSIDAVNDAPVPVGNLPSQTNVDAQTGISVAIASGFTDVDNATLSYSAAGLPAGLSIDATTGVITGTIDRSASQGGTGGVYSVTVTARDAGGLTATQTFSWTVTNPPPVAVNDTTLVINEDTTGTTVRVLANDSDPDGDPLTITGATAANGTVVVNPDGTITYTPNANFNGTDTIVYTISDGQGGTATARVPVTVNAVNDAPVRVGTLPPQTNVDAQAGISVATAGGFTDIDNTTLSYSATGLPAGLSINATTGAITGTIDRSASQGGTAGVYSVTVTARDAGGLTATQTFSWTVTNPGPTATNDTASTNEDTPIPSINVLANDSDPDGDPLTITAASAANGVVTINPDGTLRYVPNANFNGTDTITYTISDGQGGTSTARVTVTVNAVNDAPTPVGALPNRTNVDAASGINVPTAGGFTDIDNTALNYSATGLPAGLSINATTGAITGTIDRSASQSGAGGVYSVTVTARDAGGLTATQTFSWTVTNPAPVAVNDTATTNEDTPVLIPVLPNDSDPDGDPLTVIAASASVGSAVVVGNQVQYTPPANFNGTATITYTISDGQGSTATATITVTVNPVNDAPVATPIAPRNVVDGQTISVPVAPSFSDVDGDTLSFVATGLPPGLSINPATGLITGVIDKAASQTNGGVYTATITVSDGKGGMVTQTITFNVTNPGPTATNDTASTDEDTPVTISPLANDTDPDGDLLTITSASALNGTVIINTDGTVTYTPNPGFNGTDTITYEISDGNGGTSLATITVSVADINDVPTRSGTIANQTNLDNQVIALPVAGAFVDPDGDPLTFSATGLPAGLTINPTTGVISGTIDRSASQPNGGVYAITVTASDGRGGTVSQTFSWTVTNPVPGAVNDTATTNEDTPVRIVVLANDMDPDGDPLTVTQASAGKGTVTINPDGSLFYTPNPNFNGTDTIFYTITDSEGGVSTASVTVTVRPVNDAPTTVGLPNQNGDDGAAVSFSVASAFSDPDGDPLTFSATGLPPNLMIDPATGLITGTLAPETSQNGPYVVTITATDPSGATITTSFVYSVQNIPPVAVNDFASTPEDTPVRVAVLANDSDPDRDPLTITSASANNGTVVVNSDGTLTFTPNPDFNGIATVSYTISDGNGGIATATLTVTVGPVNDAPVARIIPDQVSVDSAFYSGGVAPFFSDVDGDTLTFSATGLPAGLSIDPVTGVVSGTIDRNASQVNGGIYNITVTASDGKGGTVTTTFKGTVTNPAPTAVNDTATTNEDTPVTIPVLANDNDPDGDQLTVTSATALNGTVTINPDGTISYTPNANFNGEDTITYLISDGNGGTSTATVRVTVNPVNDAPVAVNDTGTTNEDTPVTLNPLGNDSDVDGDPLTITSATSPQGAVVVNPDGTITFTPNANFNGPATITYTISDGKGDTSTATITVQVDAVNDAPLANPSTATTNEDTPVTVPVLANDTDVDGDPLTVTAATAPNGTVVLNPDGTVTYTPNANFNGTDTITYTISDGNGGFSTSTVTVAVGAVNDAPTATPIAPQSNDDSDAVSLPVSGNFSDLDGDTLSFSATALPAGLSINPATGLISGVIDKAASQTNGGVYIVTVTASDGNGGTVSQTFSWTVINPAPGATNDTATTNEDTPVTLPVLANDSDPDGDTLTVTSATAPNGTVVINPDGTITYTPKSNFNGTDTITYAISDGNGGTATATVTVTVNPVNDAPVVDTPIPSQSGVDSATVNLPISGNFSDLDGDTLSFSATGLPPGLSISPTGVITGTLDKSASQGGPAADGIYTVTVTASDGKGGTVTSTFTYTVTNPTPTATNDTATTNEDTPVTVPVRSNDSDPDGDPLIVTSATAPNGTVTINPDGTITYTPNANFNGTDPITYTIGDGNGGTATATVTVTVNPVNDAPVVDTPLPPQNNLDADVVSVPVSGNFSDLDGNTLSFSATGLPAGLSINPATGLITGTIDKGASQVNGGQFTVTVTASDGQGGTVTTTFTWSVINPGPTATDDVATATEDTPSAPIAVLANDTDPDGDMLTVTAASAPNGTVVINPDGTLTYTPNTNFNGTDTITYTISDGNGGTSTATVTVSVVAVNDVPTADPPLTNQTNVDRDSVSVDVSPNFADADGDTLTFTAVGLPLGLSIDLNSGIITGTIDRNASQPNGGVYTVTVTASDGNGGTITSTFLWTVTNPAPTATNDTATTAEDTPTTISVLNNDTDPDGDPLTVTSANAAHGTVTINPDGTITYIPDPDFNGTDTIIYAISDGNGGTSTATVTVTVTPVNDLPRTLGLPDLFNSENQVIVLPLASAFTDPEGDTLTYSATGLPTGLSIDPGTGRIVGVISATASSGGPGSDGVYTVTITVSDGPGRTISTTFKWTIDPRPPLAVDDGPVITAEDTPITVNVLGNDIDPDPTTPKQVISVSPNNGTAVVNPDGTITFTPDRDFNGTTTFVYTMTDGTGRLSTATATIVVTPVNDAPDAVPLPDQADQDGDVISITAGALFSDKEGNTLSFSATGLPAGLSIDPVTGAITGTINKAASQANGGLYSVMVTADDRNGGLTSVSFLWTVTNPGPTAVDDTASTNEDTSVTIPVLTNDTDPDADALTITSASAPNGTVTINPDGTITYTPDANFNGTDTITYVISDGQGGTSTAIVTVTVAPGNDVPTTTPLPGQSNLDSDVINLAVAGNFSDLDGDILTFTAVGLPPGLSMDGAGNITGTIDRAASRGGANGIYMVTVTASDGNGGTVSSTFSWTVTNPAPVATDDTASTNEDTPVTVAILANDSDADGDPLTVTSATAANGTVVINPDGTITYTPASNFNGIDTITYTISDGNGGVSTATVTVTVNPVNDAPVATPLSPRANVDSSNLTGANAINVAGNFSDVDGNPLTFTATGLPPGLSISAAGIISGSIDRAASQTNGGVYSVTVTANDGAGGTVSQTFSWAITNPPPVAVDDTGIVTTEDFPVTINVLANDSDPDGDLLTVATASAGNGIVTINPDGTLTYNPTADFNGTDTISYTISDGNGGTATATVTITVSAVNDPPVAINDSAATDEDTPVTIPVLTNDSDKDGDLLTVTTANAPNGRVVINPDGTVTYTPNADFNGTDTITYTISDGKGGTSTATVTVVVAPVNDPPVAVNDTGTTAEDTPVTLNVLGNDTDVDGDPLSVVSASSPDGAVTINPDGTITFTPRPDFNGTTTVTYTISDGNGGFSTATVTLTVTPVNDPPVAVDDNAQTLEDTPVTVAVLANDSDKDGDPLTVIAASAPNGSVVINPDGTITYTPNPDFNGVDIVTYTISDGKGGTSTATVTIGVGVDNDPPVSTPIPNQTSADSNAVSLSVSGNFSDVDGDPLTFSASGLPAGLSINPATGLISGTIDKAASQPNGGVYNVAVTVADGMGGTTSRSFTWTVTNPAPVAANDTATTNEDAPVTIPVLGNDSDPDGDPLAISTASAPNGTVFINPDGTLTYTPRADFNGTDTITYTINDGNGGTATATVTVTVNPVNDPPVAVNDTAQTREDTPVTVAVLPNDSDKDGHPLTVTAASAGNGTVVINPDGTITYTPNANFNGTDTVTYTISDGRGGTSTATVTIGVDAINDAPVGTAIPSQANVDNAPVNLGVAGNFSDVDGDPLTFSATGLPAGLSINPTTGIISGTIDKAASQPNGGVYSVTVTAADGKGGSASQTFTWTVTNLAPIAVNDSASTSEDTPVTVTVLGNDVDPDGDPLRVTAASAPNGSVTINPDGTITYTPRADFNGTDTITYTISDGNGGTATATVTVSVGRVNDPPVALNDAAQTREDTPVTVAVLPNDSDRDGDPLTVTAASAPNGTVAINPDGTITYTPNPNFNGTDTVTYTISDGRGGTSTATVTIGVDSINDAPVATPIANQTNVDSAPVNLGVAGNFSDVDGDLLTFSATGLPAGLTINPATGIISGTIDRAASQPNGGVYSVTVTAADGKGGSVSQTFSWTVTNLAPIAVNDSASTNEDAPVTVTVLSNDVDPDGDSLRVTTASAPNGTVVINANGTITYTPRADFNGTDTITYTISDGNGGTATATVTVSVGPVNDPPVALNDAAQTREDTPVTVAVLPNDSDRDGDPLTVTAASAPNGTVAINPDGTITYTPNPNFNGTDTVTYTISDGRGGMSTATVTIGVDAINDAPAGTAIPSQASVDNATVTLGVAGNFSDLDGDPLTFSATGLPPGLTINPATGVISGTIDKAASQTNGGAYSVTVTAADGKGGAASQTFTWTVTNPAPLAVNDTASTNEDSPVTIAVLGNDTDPDGDALRVTAASAPNGTVVINGDGTITYTPRADYNGTDTITYTISDGNGGTSTATVTVTVAPVNDPPVAINDNIETDEDVPVMIPVLVNDSDTDNDPLTVTSASAPNGTVVINPDGTITYTPNLNFNGVDTITYTISDGRGGTSTATVTVGVGLVNDPPVATAIPGQTSLDAATVSLPVAANFSDADGDPLSFSATGLPPGLTIDGVTGVISGTINKAASQNAGGVYSVTVTAADGNGGAVSQTFTWTVANPGPTAVNNTASTNEDAPVTLSVLTNDTDPDGDRLTVTSASAPNGTVVVNVDGTVTYTPLADFSGTDTITYMISDGNGGTSTATVTVTVAPVNDAPVAINDNAQTREDAPVTISVLGNDTDRDGDPLTVTSASASNGTVVINQDGTITYTPNANFNGVDTISYTISDGKGGTATATVTVGVDGINDAPAGAAIPAQTNLDAAVVSVPVAGSFSDADGDPLTFSATGLPPGLTIHPVTGVISGTIEKAASQNAGGVYSVIVTAADGNGGAISQTFAWTVTNPGPTAVNDTASTNEDAPVTVLVLTNDTDPDGDRLTVTSASAPNGTVVVNADGTVTYTPGADFSGTDTITYMISDGNGGTSTATVTVTVAPVNDAPVAINDNAQTREDAPVTIPVLGNDRDRDGDPLTVTSASAPNGTVVINPDGTITYTPNANFNGVDTITYTISDGKGGTSTATVTVGVDAINDAPVAVPIANQANPDAAVVSVPVAGNFSDADGNPLTFSATGLPPGLTINPTTGVISGTIDKAASQNAGGVYSVTVTAADGKGGAVSQTFTWTVTNPGPTAVNDTASTNEDAPVTIPVLTNDTDPDGDRLTVTSASAPNGSVFVNADGTVTYTPRADFNGTDTITYMISDGNGGTSTATVTVTVAPVNDASVAINDNAQTREDTPFTIPVLGNDSDKDGDPLTVTAASAPNGTVVINSDGTITYTPNPNFNGVDMITYTISDGKGGTSTATVTVGVDSLNDAPVGTAIPNQANPDSAVVSLPVAANFSDVDGDPLTFSATGLPAGLSINPATGLISGTIDKGASQPNGGVYTVNVTASDGKGGAVTRGFTWTVTNPAPVATNDTATTSEDAPVRVPVLANDRDSDGDPLTVSAASAPNGRVTTNPDGTVTYTPNANFNGTDTITYTISDGNGGTSTATVTVTVAPVNDAPIARNDSATTPEDTPVTVPVLPNDSDPDGDPLRVTLASAANGTVIINPDGTLRYTPNPDFNGTDSITYTISDGKGGTSTATVSITVTPVNDAPIAVNDTGTTLEDQPVTLNLLANDSDVDGDPLTVTSATSPNGTVVINPDGTITFTPNPNFNGPAVITYTVSDGKGGTRTATATVNVTPINDPPMARPDVATTPEDTPLRIAPLANDSDVDGDPLRIVAASSPNGTVVINPDGTVTYTPDPNFNGTDTITYQVSDGKGGLTTATVTVTVGPVNDPPVARNDVFTMDEDTTARISVLANDFELDGDRLTITSATSPNGTVTINPDGTISFTPNRDFFGPATITYTISDGKGGTSTATVAVTVRNINELPSDRPETISTVGGVINTINVTANASDPDGDPLRVFTVKVDVGTVSINPDGTLSYTAPPEFQGVATITYILSDGKGGFVQSTVTVFVQQAAADINTLLGIKPDQGLDDGWRIDRVRDQTEEFIEVPLIVDQTANNFRSLNPIPQLFGEHPLLTAINGLSSLRGITELGEHPVGDVVGEIDRIRDIRFGVDRLFDPRFGDFIVKSLTGFSVRQLGTGSEQVMIESVVRDRVIYMEARDIGKDSDPRVVEYQLRTRDGKPLPDWIRMDPRGLAIIERPVDAEEVRLILRAIRADGKVIEVPVVIQGATGEIQLDTPLKGQKISAAQPLGASLALASSATTDEAARLAAAFNGEA